MERKKIAFVTPWYGEEIGGGAEAELRGLVHHLHDACVDLEVLSTCVKCFTSDWNEDFHKPGLTTENDIPVRRFRVRKRDTAAFDEVNIRLMRGLPITLREEEIFCREMINSPDLYNYIREHSNEYALFVFIPYMFGPVYQGCQIHPEKSVLIPCLHDESYAYMKCFVKAFSKVKGMIFHSGPERVLAKKLYGIAGENYSTLGEGIETQWASEPERFRKKYGISESFVLYAGRKDTGKCVDVLVRFFSVFKDRNPSELKLILLGGGKIDLPDRDDIMDLGFVDMQDKYDAYGAATLFCNPSQMESFSIVIMESWLAGIPVLVNGKCAVTRDFVHQANGGLYYESYPEFEVCLKYIFNHSNIATQMGQNGRSYVQDNFQWDVIVKRYLDYFQRIGKSNS